MHSNIGSKYRLINEKSSFLWHKILEYISKGRIESKQLTSTKRAKRSNDLLKLIHSDICGLFSVPCLSRERYFSDDLFHYSYVYLIYNKSQVVDIIEIYIIEIEKQLGKKVKVMRFNRGGEYMINIMS